MNFQSWTGYNDPRFGYGSMFHGFKNALPKTVALDKHASVNIHMSVPNVCKGWFTGQHRVCFTMWETTELPIHFKTWLGQYDQIIVPCEQNVELFSEFHDNVKYVPLGVDHKFWKPEPHFPDGPFRFHAGGSLWMRKGLDIVVKAFTALGLPNSELHIKAAPHARDTPNNLPPNVFLYREWMNGEQQREWFHKADCFIAASRGEGFGLMPLQAIAAGIPTILSETFGQAQFADAAWKTIPVTKSKANTVGFWDEPDQKVLEELMMLAYQSRGSLRDEAKPGVAKTEPFAWKHSTRKLLAAVPSGVKLDDPIYEEPNVRVEAQVNRRVNAVIGSEILKLVPGVTYRISENSYHMLTDSGAIV